MTDLTALAALLAAATPGPWRHYRDKLRPQFSARINEIQARQKAPIVAWSGFDDSDRSEDKHAANAALIVALRKAAPSLIEAARREAAASELQHVDRDNWPDAISDGLTLPCADCGEVPRFDYIVEHEFWRKWVPNKPARLGVVCLPCLDKRCGGVGLAAALEGVQWTGTGHTVELLPSRRFEYDRRALLHDNAGAALPAEGTE